MRPDDMIFLRKPASIIEGSYNLTMEFTSIVIYQDIQNKVDLKGDF